MFFDIVYFWKEFWYNWYGLWFTVGFIVGLYDLKHYYTKGDNITLKHVLDLMWFTLIGFIGFFIFVYIHGNEITLIKHKEK